MEITTIQDATKYLTECARRAESGFKIHPEQLALEVGVSPVIFEIAFEKTIFEETENGYHKTNTTVFPHVLVREIIGIYEIIERILAKREPMQYAVAEQENEHQSNLYVEKGPVFKMACKICKADFIAKHWNAQYCSDKCRIKNHNTK